MKRSNLLLRGALPLAVVACLWTASAAQTFGPPIGRIYLSVDPLSQVDEGTIDVGVPLTIYVVAEIDFGSSRNDTDGIAGWEATVVLPPEVFLLATRVRGNGAVNLDSTARFIVGLDDCLLASSSPIVLAELDIVIVTPVNDLLICLGTPTPSSFETAPTGLAPGWVECQPYQDIRYPFEADWVNNCLLLNKTFVDLTLGSFNTFLTENPCRATDFAAEIKNDGNLASVATNVTLWLSDDLAFPAGDTLLETYAIPAIAPMSSHMIYDLLTFDPSDFTLPVPKFVGVVIDDPDVNEESDENNNSGGWALQATGLDITSIVDVPNDQGSQVRVKFRGALDDGAASDPVLSYEVRRKNDTTGTFDFVASVPAFDEDTYSVVVPTLDDTSPKTFQLRAVKVDPFAYVESCEAAGQSIDNLNPATPKSLTIDYGPSGNTLRWAPSEEPDVTGYRIYRHTEAGFEPKEVYRVHTTTSTEWSDGVADPLRQHYLVTAVDEGGNESLPATESPPAEGPPRSYRWALHSNVPNPFNPATNIVFETARPGFVEVSIFDLSGRHVTTVVSERLEAGLHDRVWSGDDHQGRPVGSGVYFYRMVTADFTQVRKMTLLR